MQGSRSARVGEYGIGGAESGASRPLGELVHLGKWQPGG